MHDVLIIGGGYAGMAAAMPLARAARDVVVLDVGVGATALRPRRTASSVRTASSRA